MPESVQIVIDGRPLQVRSGITVAVALLEAGHSTFRTSVSGEPRAPLCGMGICFECRVTIDDEPHRRSCQVLCAEGMRIQTA